MALGIDTPLVMAVDWTPRYGIIMFFMWWSMMIAMMLPSAAPMILLYTVIEQRGSERAGRPVRLLPTVGFVSGYLALWAAFSAIAVALQWGFERIGVLSPVKMNSTNFIFAGMTLLIAGVYQLSPLKQTCLKHCQGPISFLTHHWRNGVSGAFRMGMKHGLFCVGCCWGLMAILFFGGIMNLYWIIGLAVLVMLEKFVPDRRQRYLTGAVFSVWGLSFLIRGLT